MKIVKAEDLHCDAGWRVNSFLKITTDEGLVGWSEYMEGYGAQGLTGIIQKLAERFLIGRDPRPVEAISALLYAATRQAAGGVNQMAIAAIENALVDIKAKALGVPVYEMLGGPVRDRLQLYWSHCGTYRARHADKIREWAGVDPVRSLDDIVALGEEVKRKGFKGLKTNLIRFDQGKAYMYGPGTGNPPGFPELNVDHRIVDAAVAQLEAFRRGAGRDVGLHLDTNFNYNFNGHLGSLISAHFSAVVPNFKVMEIDIDDVLWKDDIVTQPPVIDNGDLLLPTGPGWGADVNEKFVRAHPPKR